MMARGLLLAAMTVLLLHAAAKSPPPSLLTAFHDGVPVRLELAPAARRQRPLRLGPWRLGDPDPHAAMRDRHPNLYVIVPGSEYVSRTAPQYDHTLVLSAMPDSDSAVDWDVIWVAVIDPRLRANFRDERSLLLAAQQTFRPGDLFDVSDAPGRALLREFFGVRSYRELAGYERHGRLPRLMVQPAGFSIRATAVAPATTANPR